MNDRAPEIRLVPIDAITVLNPRTRNRRVFDELVASIAHLGLKKPITVAARPAANGAAYHLVCGQGRLEAFRVLGQRQIPAVVIEASDEDCHVMSLVENLARRTPSSLELVREIAALRERGYSVAEVAAKLDFSPEYVSAICGLLERGEERLLAAVEKGLMPHSIAMEIARAADGEVQQALAEAYERGLLPGNRLLAIRRIIEERNQRGKALRQRPAGNKPGTRPVTAAKLIRAYRKEAHRQRLLVKRAELAQARLLFIVNALRQLFADEHFLTLLRAEGLDTLPAPLAERLGLPEAGDG